MYLSVSLFMYVPYSYFCIQTIITELIALSVFFFFSLQKELLHWNIFFAHLFSLKILKGYLAYITIKLLQPKYGDIIRKMKFYFLLHTYMYSYVFSHVRVRVFHMYSLIFALLNEGSFFLCFLLNVQWIAFETFHSVNS